MGQDSFGFGEMVEVTVIRHQTWLQQNWMWIVAVILVFIIFWSLMPKTNVYVTRKEVSQ